MKRSIKPLTLFDAAILRQSDKICSLTEWLNWNPSRVKTFTTKVIISDTAEWNAVFRITKEGYLWAAWLVHTNVLQGNVAAAEFEQQMKTESKNVPWFVSHPNTPGVNALYHLGAHRFLEDFDGEPTPSVLPGVSVLTQSRTKIMEFLHHINMWSVPLRISRRTKGKLLRPFRIARRELVKTGGKSIRLQEKIPPYCVNSARLCRVSEGMWEIRCVYFPRVCAIDPGLYPPLTIYDPARQTTIRYFKPYADEYDTAITELTTAINHQLQHFRQPRVAKMLATLTRTLDKAQNQLVRTITSDYTDLYFGDFITQKMPTTCQQSHQVLHQRYRIEMLFKKLLSVTSCRLVVVNEYLSTKRCSECKHVNNQVTGCTKYFCCVNCGILRERNENAAINILQAGLLTDQDTT